MNLCMCFIRLLYLQITLDSLLYIYELNFYFYYKSLQIAVGFIFL